MYCCWNKAIVTDKPAVVPSSGMSRSSPAAFPNVGAGAGIFAGPDYVCKTPFDNIASGIGKAGVCERVNHFGEWCKITRHPGELTARTRHVKLSMGEIVFPQFLRFLEFSLETAKNMSI